jgi:Holliday junction resolvase RusA-like endonuclease
MTRTSDPGYRLRRSRGGRTVSLILYLNPVPASRPRVSKWGTYYGKRYTQWRKDAEAIVPDQKKQKLTGPLFVELDIISHRPRSTKRQWPLGDTDNYEKAVYDFLTRKGFWKDDDQIVLGYTSKRYAEAGEKPRCEILIKEIDQ